MQWHINSVITANKAVITELGKSRAVHQKKNARLCFARAFWQMKRQFPCEVPMNIHEYQAKALLKQYGAPVSEGRAVLSADEAEAKARELPGPLWVVKSQIHAGGRGKGRFKEAEAGEKGGVRLAKSVDEVVQSVRQMP